VVGVGEEVGLAVGVDVGLAVEVGFGVAEALGVWPDLKPVIISTS
jgi:hypothetical protein